MKEIKSAKTLHDYLYEHIFLTFILFIITGLVFGVLTINLFHQMAANWSLIVNHGWIVLKFGALTQLLQLLLTAMIALTAFIFFKVCEGAISKRIGDMRIGSFFRRK